jgi:hypothetical protein
MVVIFSCEKMLCKRCGYGSCMSHVWGKLMQILHVIAMHINKENIPHFNFFVYNRRSDGIKFFEHNISEKFILQTLI